MKRGAVVSAQHNTIDFIRTIEEVLGILPMDFSSEDRFDFARYNRILWKGLAGDIPYPERPTGLDLRANRKELLGR